MAKTPKVKRVHGAGQRPWRRPRCEATVADQTARWREESGRDDRCQFLAWFDVDGKQLCDRHAGIAVLAALTEG